MVPKFWHQHIGWELYCFKMTNPFGRVKNISFSNFSKFYLIFIWFFKHFFGDKKPSLTDYFAARSFGIRNFVADVRVAKSAWTHLWGHKMFQKIKKWDNKFVNSILTDFYQNMSQISHILFKITESWKKLINFG